MLSVSGTGYHFGTMSSPDGITWSNFTDVSYQIQARADTSNNVVFDDSTEEWMIFTRIDCHYAPFSANPSLNGIDDQHSLHTFLSLVVWLCMLLECYVSCNQTVQSLAVELFPDYQAEC